MKKLFCLLLSLLMVISLAACSGGKKELVNNVKLNNTKELVSNDSAEIESMDYVVTALASNHEYNVNFVDGLIEADSLGNYVGCLAETWESNEDATVWTFHLRDGVKWVTNTGEEYATVKADDLVTGLRHAAEFHGGANYTAADIAGYVAYEENGDFSDEAWAQVGVKAIDDLTLEFTLSNPVPYFVTVVEYTNFYPVNREFLENKGAGCKLGAPDAGNCAFGVSAPDSILYNGAFILDTYDVKSKIVLTKNPSYWDADKIYLDKWTTIFDDGSDPYSVMKAFEQGTNAAAGLNASWEDFPAYKEKYAQYLTTSLPNGYAFGVVFNYNRVLFDHTNYAGDETLRANTKAAIRNANFRRALRAAFDVETYASTTMAEEVAKATTRNLNMIYDMVKTSDGVLYGELVEKHMEEDLGVKDIDLNDGHYEWYDPAAAKEYIEAAKAEGIVFPVHLDMLVIETSDRLVKQAQSMKQSVEAATDGQIIIEIVMAPMDDVYNIAYYSTVPEECDYDISTFTGWGPDYIDPKTFVQIYSPTEGYYMQACGLGDGDQNADVKALVGFDKYEELYQAANNTVGTDDASIDKRYDLFAQAEAFLLEEALYIPTTMQTRALRVSHGVPFTAPYSYGVSQYKYKGFQLQEDIVTAEQYNAAKDAWDKARAK